LIIKITHYIEILMILLKAVF